VLAATAYWQLLQEMFDDLETLVKKVRLPRKLIGQVEVILRRLLTLHFNCTDFQGKATAIFGRE